MLICWRNSGTVTQIKLFFFAIIWLFLQQWFGAEPWSAPAVKYRYKLKNGTGTYYKMQKAKNKATKRNLFYENKNKNFYSKNLHKITFNF